MRIHTKHNYFILIVGFNSFVIHVFVNNIKIIEMKKSGIIEKIKAKLITRFLIVNRSYKLLLGLENKKKLRKKNNQAILTYLQ